MENDKKVKSHIFLGQTGKSEKYTYPINGGGNKALKIPELIRNKHGESFRSQLNNIKKEQSLLKKHNEKVELKSGIGIQIAFESFEDVDLKYESLANQTQGIELLNVRKDPNQTFANVYVPDGKLDFYSKKLNDYLEYKK